MCEAEYEISTSTSTLRQHLLSVHSSTYAPNNQSNKPIQKPYTPTEQKHITTKLTQWVTVDLQPFSVVEQAEFKEFIYTLDSHYIVPCRQTIKKEIESLFSQRRTNLILEINNITSKNSLTTDI